VKCGKVPNNTIDCETSLYLRITFDIFKIIKPHKLGVCSEEYSIDGQDEHYQGQADEGQTIIMTGLGGRAIGVIGPSWNRGYRLSGRHGRLSGLELTHHEDSRKSDRNRT
jgi:hypothetical protein